MSRATTYGVPESPEEVAALGRLAVHAFGMDPEYWGTYAKRIGTSSLRVLRRGRDVIAGLAVYESGQWFAGRSVPTAPVAAVCVGAEARGQGAAERLMTDFLLELRASGASISPLFASAPPLYRKVGYESAGAWVAYRAALASLGRREHGLGCREVGLDEVDTFRAIHQAACADECGPLDRGTALWTRIGHPPKRTCHAWVVGPAEAPEGYVIFDALREGDHRDLEVRDWAATTPRARERLLALAADHRSTMRDLLWAGAAADGWLATLRDSWKIDRHELWMLRIVDVPRAFQSRGWRKDVAGEAHMEVADEAIEENRGRWVLTVEGGSATMRQGGRGDVRCHVRGLAPLYTGLWPARTLRSLGLLDAPDAAVTTLESLLSGPSPWMPDHF